MFANYISKSKIKIHLKMWGKTALVAYCKLYFTLELQNLNSTVEKVKMPLLPCELRLINKSSLSQSFPRTVKTCETQAQVPH